jgi:hypothetical protein
MGSSQRGADKTGSKTFQLRVDLDGQIASNNTESSDRRSARRALVDMPIWLSGSALAGEPSQDGLLLTGNSTGGLILCKGPLHAGETLKLKTKAGSEAQCRVIYVRLRSGQTEAGIAYAARKPK